jgi:glycolate oxidase
MSSSPAVVAGDLVHRMAAVVGSANCISDDCGLLVYECDGLTHGRTRPGLVVLPGWWPW